MSTLLKLARKPAVTVSPDATVLEAVNVMLEHKVGAVIVLDDGRARGVFTERDVMAKIVALGRDPAKTKVASVMTSPVLHIDSRADAAEALELMLERHIRHLPVVDADQRVIGTLSMRHLMREQIDKLQDRARSLENYIGTEGIAGG